MFPQRTSFAMLWLLLVTWVQPSYSSALYAYATERTVQVGAQDPVTGKIYYSSCNSEDTPIFPLDKPNILDAKQTPRNGTALAAAGWWDTQTITASIFWQTKDGIIVNGYYTCNMTTGKLVRKDEYQISETAEVDSIHSESGLSVELLGANDGYRVFYHNENRQVMMMSYTTVTNWIDGGAVSQDTATGMALGSTHYDKENITVAFPKGSDDIETSRLEKSGTWKLAAFPQELTNTYTNDTLPSEFTPSLDRDANFSLPAWNSSVEAIGSAVDRSRTRSIFYIGDDKKLYEAAASKNSWQLASNQTKKAWPVADKPSSGLAVAYQQSEGEAWVYYWSNKTIVQAYKNYDGEWENAQALPQKVASNETRTKPHKDKIPLQEEPSHSSGLSSGAKAGIGVGVGISALLLVVVAWLWRRRRNSRTADNRESFDGTEAMKETPKGADPSEMDSPGPPAELDHHSSVVYELPGQYGRQS
ncbi:hypothetical protein KAF25_001361 [Fusarium avenaceum]|uniref:Fucose-specific lectin n=1 Tax=Fusarium avenaceum TaxID=40199 RepID=A0A9P7H8J8_9HYPO|nr:hypothetical protein KAF25_001361 [Fusarium avenaceum]